MEGLISTDALLKRTDWYSPDVRDAVRNALRYVPTVDAVEVVRCKDCTSLYDGWCIDYGIHMDDNEFCSGGERRQTDETD